MTADAPKKRSFQKGDFDEPVTVRDWAGDKLLDARNAVMLRKSIGGKQAFYIWTAGAPVTVPVKSEVTDKGGVTWVVTRNSGGPVNPWRLVYVAKKGAPETHSSG